jgi:hypothetical protein
VDAPHFVAGLVLDADGVCVEAAPILRWCVGMHWSALRVWMRDRGWRAARAA